MLETDLDEHAYDQYAAAIKEVSAADASFPDVLV